MKQITQTGATKEEAISLALQKLDVTQEQVEIEVLQEAKKGFLGFGARPCKIRVTVIEQKVEVEEEKQTVEKKEPSVDPIVNQEQPLEQDIEEVEEYQEQLSKSNVDELVQEEETENPIENAKEYLVNIAKEMKIHDLKIEAKQEGKMVYFNLESEKAALLIGKRGSTLNALQQLTQLVLNKTAKTYLNLRLDVENYRERRQVALEQLAERMADKALRTGRKVSLEPMPSYERKIIHNALANRVDVETYSEGTEPNRHLVIEPVK